MDCRGLLRQGRGHARSSISPIGSSTSPASARPVVQDASSAHEREGLTARRQDIHRGRPFAAWPWREGAFPALFIRHGVQNFRKSRARITGTCNEGEHPRRELALDQPEVVDGEGRSIAPVLGVEMGRTMFLVVHGDDDAQESADLRHKASSADRGPTEQCTMDRDGTPIEVLAGGPPAQEEESVLRVGPVISRSRACPYPRFRERPPPLALSPCRYFFVLSTSTPDCFFWRFCPYRLLFSSSSLSRSSRASFSFLASSCFCGSGL